MKASAIIVDSGNTVKVVPEADAKLQQGPGDRRCCSRAGDQVVTQIFRLDARVRHRPRAGPAPAHHRQASTAHGLPQQQLPGRHRLRRRPPADRPASSPASTCPSTNEVERAVQVRYAHGQPTSPSRRHAHARRRQASAARQAPHRPIRDSAIYRPPGRPPDQRRAR
jgi:hypothetical protein